MRDEPPDLLRERLSRELAPTHTIVRELAGGGMSRVFVAHERALKRDVVVKVLPPDLVSSDSTRRFRQEIELTAGLQHPNILPVLAAGGSGDCLYYFVPYIAAESLRDRLKAAPLGFDDALRLTCEVLGALQAAHARGIVHRDVKPGNVLLSAGHAILADFGIARALDSAAPSIPAEASTLAGARAYAAPERDRGTAADIYSVAVMAHEMLLGDPGRAGSAAPGIAEALARRHAIPPTRAANVAAVLSSGMARAPQERPATAAEFRNRLQRASLDTPTPRRYVAVASAGAALIFTVLLATTPWSPAPDATGSPAALAAGPAAPAFRDTAGTLLQLAPGSAPPRDPVDLLRDSALAARAAGSLSETARLYEALEVRVPDDPTVPLRAAVARLWTIDPTGAEAMRAAAGRAHSRRDRLSSGDAALADAVLAMAERRYPDACASFERARAAGADAFDVWMGLGDCRALDDHVVAPDSGAPARFRSSFAAAAQAYVRAIRSVPGGAPSFAYRRLDRVVFVQANRVRRGQSPDGRTWFARSTVAGDTIAFNPFDPRERRGPPDPAADAAAAATARRFLRPLYVEWTRIAPDVVASHEALAELLETAGQVQVATGDGLTALSVNEAALRVARDSTERLRLTRDRIRLFVRSWQWRDAARLADSVVTANPNPDPRDALAIAGPAALAGRINEAARLAAMGSARPDRAVRLSDGRVADLPAPVLRERAEFLVRAAAGLCDGAVRSAVARLESQIAAFRGAEDDPALRQGVFERPVGMGLGCLGIDAAMRMGAAVAPPARSAQALARGDTTMARGLLAAMDRQRAANPGVAENLEALATDVAVRRALGELREPAALQARFLDLLISAPPLIVEQETWAALIGRTLVELADAERAMGLPTAPRWAAAAAQLWQYADASLQPTVERMRAIASDSR